MKVRVFAPSFLDLSALDDDGYLTLGEGATVNTLYKKMRIPLPLRPLVFCAINYKQAKLTHKLKDGDTVSVLAVISGG